MKKIFSFLVILLCIAISSVFGYDLTDADNELLDSVEDQIIVIIDDESNSVTPENFVSYAQKILDTRELTQRQWTLLEIIIDDISWEYEIWEYVSENDVIMLPEDCYEDEYYDEEDQTCYYSEGDDYDDETDYISGEFSWNHDEHDESKVVASYNILQDSITLLEGVDSIKNQEVWNIFTALIPLSVRWDFIRYEVVDDAQSDTAAHVVQTQDDNTKWVLSINLSAFYVDGVLEPEESYATLIHEFAHVMTLNLSQMRYYPEQESDAIIERFEDSCEWNLLQEWCLKGDAYLSRFIDTFWNDSEYLEKVRSEEVSAYEDTPESFVTDYAATNPWEDIAESFTYFVLRSKPEWDTIADEKLRFFYNYSELDSLRKQIRSNLAALK